MNFHAYADYYNLIYREKDYSREASFIQDILKQFHPVARKILDLGCGTGKHAAALEKLGYMVTGVDVSEKMISIAKQTNKHAFFQADLRNVRLPAQFDVVVSLFDVISYQVTDDDMNQAFATASHHLEAGGMFIFDVWHGPGVETDPPVVMTKEFKHETLNIKRIATPIITWEKNLVDVNLVLMVCSEESETRTIEENHCMRYFFPKEIEVFAARHHFSVLSICQWYADKTGIDDKSWKAIYVLKKDGH